MILAALPGIVRTSPKESVKVGCLGKYRKVRTIVEGRFSQGVLGGTFSRRFARGHWQIVDKLPPPRHSSHTRSGCCCPVCRTAFMRSLQTGQPFPESVSDTSISPE